MDFHKSKRLVITNLLIIFIAVSLFFPFYNAHAQFIVTDIPNLLQNSAEWIWEQVKEALRIAWENGGAIAYRNSINFFLQQVAQQSAEYIATGGKGQKPMFLRDPNYWTKLGDQVLGEWIEQTAKSDLIGFKGRSLCDPIDPTIKFNMIVGFDYKYQEMMFDPDMSCSWSTIKKRYKELRKKKLFDFTAELNEGAAGRIRGELAGKIQGSPSLIGDAKKLMLNGLDKIGIGEQELNKISQRLKKISDGIEKFSDSVMADLKEGWQENIKEFEAEKKAVLESDIVKKAKICLGQDKLAACRQDYCRALMPGNPYVEDCIRDYKEYQNAINIIIYYSQQVGDFFDKSLSGAKDVLEYFADFQPTTEENLSMEDLNREYNPEASDVAVMFQVQSQLFAKQAEAIENSKFMQGLTGDINRLSSKISNLTLTPSSFVDEQARQAVKSGIQGPLVYTKVAAADAIGVFTNTLINKLLKQVFEKGLNPEVSPEIAGRTTPFLSNADELNSPGKEESKVLYADLAVASVKRGGKITIYDEFAVCPENAKYALPTNCLLDNKLVRAMEEGLTIKEAIDKGWLDGGQLVGEDSGLLSWSNTKKLRRYRIFPLGLEIAADKIHNDPLKDTQVSLNEIVFGFNQNGNDGVCGTGDENESPFCHLVDPNWVLKDLTYQCDIKGYTAIPLAGSTQRQETCVDLKDCIHEDEAGECDTWAYCTREKNIWRFDGDECDSQYASCQIYQRTKDKQQFSYLTNTLDFANCNQNNAGCLWYCSQWDEELTEGGKWACESPGWSTIKLEDKVCDIYHECTSPDGCLCSVADKSCLVPQGESTCTYPVYDKIEDRDNTKFFNNKIATCSSVDEGCHEYIRTAPELKSNLVFNGSFELDTDANAVPDGWQDPGWEGTWEGTETINSDEHFSGSFSYKFEHFGADGNKDYTGRWQLVPVVPGGKYTISVRVKVEMVPENFTVNYYFDDNGAGYIEGNTGTTTVVLDGSDNDWQQHIQTIVVPANRHYVWLGPIMFGDGVVYVDALKLESGNKASSYSEYGEINKIYLKSSSSCQAREVGCELYTPVNGGQSVPGIVGTEDKCSYQCLGYNTFQEIPTNLETDSRWVNFIPSTAKMCMVPGCEEFTNLETEKTEYYSYLRQCVKTNEQNQAIVDHLGTLLAAPNSSLCQYYYTWVGSENTGYQLKKYFLEKDPVDNGPANFISRPDLTWGVCENSNDALINPHCKQFYDSAGKIYYRLYKNTITCSPDCALYRRSADQSVKTVLAAESETCSKQDNGCRKYKGSSGDNIRNVFSDSFEEGNIAPWAAGESYLDVIYAGESVVFPGHSMGVQQSGAYPGAALRNVKRDVFSLVSKDKTYFLSFWAKTRGAASRELEVRFKGTDVADLSFGKKTINNEWNEYTFGPLIFDRIVAVDEKLWVLSDKQKGTENDYYLDNVVLKEVQDNLYLVKDSWTTPCACDTLVNHVFFATRAKNCTAENTANVSLVGCQVYQNRAGQANYLKSFSKLCSSAVVGCEALIDTQNSDWPLAKTFNAGGAVEDRIVILPDKLVYLINDSNNECDSKYKGCQKFGQPTLDTEGNVVSYTDVYLVNDPDLYVDSPILCLKEDVGCEEYEGPHYFKDPGEKICEYRENVTVGGENKTGWFKKDTNNACYYRPDGSPYESKGGLYGIYLNGDPDYKGWVGLCPASQSSCTEFIDPLEQNVVVNGGFEQGLDGWPEDYVPDHEYTNYQIFNDVSYSGKKSIKLWSDSNNPSSAVQVFSADIPVEANAFYNLSAWVKGQNVADTNGDQNKHPWIGMHVYNVKGNPVATWQAITDVPYDTFDWQIIQTLNYKMPSSANYVRLMLTFEGETTGAVWFDNIKLVGLTSKASYFYLNNNKLDKSSCQNMAGLKDGCILFNDTSQSKDSLIYDAVSTYANSYYNNNDLKVSIVNAFKEEGDANVVLKVRRDRVCGEWLTCVGAREVWDPALGEKRQVCEFVGRCDKLIGKGEGGICGHYVYANPQLLSEALYKSRNLSWSGMDYSGYSIPNMYPVETLFASETSPGVYQLTYQGKGVDGGDKKINKTCQIFPENDSPFPKDGEERNSDPKNNYYQGVNVCNDQETGDYPDCQCSYIKTEYSGKIRYSNVNSSGIPFKICISGDNIGVSCSSDSSFCGDGGYCAVKSKETKYVGLRNFCLERDESKPVDINACLTWWPGAGMGDTDIYQIYSEAGVSSATLNNKSLYCVREISSVNASFEDVAGDHDDASVDGCETKTYNVSGLPPAGVKMSEVEKIRVRIGVDDAVDQTHWDHLDAQGYVDLTAENGWIGNKEDDSDENPDFDCTCDGGGACIKVKACFGDACTNTSDDFLHHFSVIMTEKSGGLDLDPYASGRFAEADVHLKKRCLYLAKISLDNQGMVKGAYTERLWEKSSWYNDNDGSWENEPYGISDVITAETSRMIVPSDDSTKSPKKHTEASPKNLFAYSSHNYWFNSEELVYNNVIEPGWDLRYENTSANKAPKVASVNVSSCDENFNCAKLSDGKITINGKDNGDIVRSQSLPVTLKFFAWADDNQMPIREVSVNWGLPGAVSTNLVVAKNHMPKDKCSKPGDDQEFWGKQPQACEEKYFQFTYTYTCEGENSPGWNPTEKACVFQPMVYVKDNWSWCTNGKYAGDSLCNNIQEAAVFYDGEIIIKP